MSQPTPGADLSLRGRLRIDTDHGPVDVTFEDDSIAVSCEDVAALAKAILPIRRALGVEGGLRRMATRLDRLGLLLHVSEKGNTVVVLGRGCGRIPSSWLIGPIRVVSWSRAFGAWRATSGR